MRYSESRGSRSPTLSKTTLDSLVAAGLAFALLLVIGLDKLLTKPQPLAAAAQAIVQPVRMAAKPLRLAVSHTKKNVWDDMGRLLDNLGAGYKHQTVSMSDLYDSKKYDDFDVLFLTCSSEGNDQVVADNLRRFVARGGTLYASDWRFLVVALAFPDFVNNKVVGEGNVQSLTADVLDPGLADALGTTKIPLVFNLDQWKTAAFGGDRVKVLMKAPRYLTQQNDWAQAPLLVKFGFDKGTVIFTSFHNEAQNSEIEQKLLKYLVFSAVTAQIENEVHQTMLKGGFSPRKSNLLSASAGQSEFTNVYQTKKAGSVRFVLGFAEQGARLRLTVVGPNGNKRVEEGTSTVVIEAPSAVAGQWRYTVTALTVPYPDFPFTLTVGEAQP
jgi:hypothetical protein